MSDDNDNDDGIMDDIAEGLAIGAGIVIGGAIIAAIIDDD